MFKFVLFKLDKHVGSIQIERFGTSYGGWWVPKFASELSVKKLLVSAGLGFDTSFDEALLARGWHAIGIDPLKESCDRANSRFQGFKKFEILNCGLSVSDGHEVFYQPKNLHHDSWSTINVQSVENPQTISFPVVSMNTLRSQFFSEFDYPIRFLKMDIEGAELALFQDAIQEFDAYNILGVELDFLALIPFRKILLRITRILLARKILSRLSSRGWTLIHVENANFFWIKLSDFEQ
jgi:FkbM family methyltransferase